MSIHLQVFVNETSTGI